MVKRCLRYGRLWFQTTPGFLGVLLLFRRISVDPAMIAVKGWLSRLHDRTPLGSRVPRHLLLVEQYLPRSGSDAGSLTLLQFIRTFSENNWQVSVCCLDGNVAWLLDACSDQQSAETYHSSWLFFSPWWRRHRHRFDAVLLSRPSVASVVLPVLLRSKPRRLLYYGHDLHCQRLEAEAALKGQPELHHIANRFSALERKIWRACDYSFYPSQAECDFARALEPNAAIEPVVAYRFEPSAFPALQIPPGMQLLFVGNFRHEPNVDAVRWLIEEIWPSVLKQCPSSQLRIAGAGMSPDLHDWIARAAGVVSLGWLDEVSLRTAYDTARVVVAPLRFGAGIKHKIVAALAHGRPVVTTPVGLQGLDFLASFMPCSAEASILASFCLELLCNDALWSSRARQGQDAVLSRFSPASQWAVLGQALT